MVLPKIKTRIFSDVSEEIKMMQRTTTQEVPMCYNHYMYSKVAVKHGEDGIVTEYFCCDQKPKCEFFRFAKGSLV